MKKCLLFIVLVVFPYMGLAQASGGQITRNRHNSNVEKRQSKPRKQSEHKNDEVEKENACQYSNYVGKWEIRTETENGLKMIILTTFNADHSGSYVIFHDRGNVADVVAHEEYPQCILSDSVIYMTKDGDIYGKGVAHIRVRSDGLYSFDRDMKFIRKSK